MKIYNQEEVKQQVNSKSRLAVLKEEATKCTLYSYILLNYYSLHLFLDKNKKKLSEKDLEKKIPFYVEIMDKDHPHVYIDKETSKLAYDKQYESFSYSSYARFIDKEVIGLSIKELQTYVFGKNRTMSLRARSIADAVKSEKKSTEIIRKLKEDNNADIIENNSEIDMIKQDMYVESVFRLTYAGKEENRPSWLYDYPETEAEREIIKYDVIKLISSMKRVIKVSSNKDIDDLVDDRFKRRR